MERHPYKISMFTRLKQQNVLRLTPVDLSSEFGMSGRMKVLLDEVTTCKRCKKKCVDVDTHFTCEGIYEDVFADDVQVKWSTDLELLLSQADMQRVMDGVRYEASCYAAFRRSQRLRNAGDRYTEDEVKDLFNTQQGIATTAMKFWSSRLDLRPSSRGITTSHFQRVVVTASAILCWRVKVATTKSTMFTAMFSPGLRWTG